MTVFGFGELRDGQPYPVLDERVVRGSAGLMLLVGFVAFVNGFVVKNYAILPWLTGFLSLNFGLAVLVNPKLSPTFALARIFVWRQSPLYIGAVQKRFAWSLGLALSSTAFALSLKLVDDATWFEPVCMLCLICLLFLFLETAFGICVGCQIYKLAVRLGVFPKPAVTPRCTGDACEPLPPR